MVVTKDTKIGEILDADTGTAQFFMELGMHCLGCPAARSETLGEACMVHGQEPDGLVNKINEYFGNK
ncbi:MAG: DUF1858 domain-containing protein [Oscillospiraceae bacterium]|nr:DUF1858 domain-containing protein [Oscillospiraceae bacterium]